MKKWIIRDCLNLHNLAIIEAETNLIALYKYKKKHEAIYKNCHINPYGGTYAIQGNKKLIDVWEHVPLY